MIDDLPNPPVPADADLRDFPFTPVFRARLFGSSFHARTSDAGWRAGVTLWLKSWDQSPAGSLPDDDIDLCRLAELGRDLKTWRKVRVEALWGWSKCSDGKLYHPVVAEGVNEAWRGKLEQRWRTECGRIKKANQRNHTDVPVPTFEAWSSQRQSADVPRDKGDVSPGTNAPPPETRPECPPTVPEETPSKGKGKGQGQGQRDSDDVDERRATAERVLRSIGAWDDPNIQVHAGRCFAWIDNGADPDIDIIPTLQAVLAKARRARGDPAWLPTSLNFFDQPVADAISRRSRPLPEGNPNGPRPVSPPRGRTSTADRRALIAEVFAADLVDGGGPAGERR